MLDSSTPLVSIIVITFNSSKYVIETLESIKKQNYEHLELIVADDASLDKTVELCKEWINKNKYRFVRAKLICSHINTGISANCNRGLNVSNGDWVKIIAGDDALEPDFVGRNMEFASADPEIACICSRIREYNECFVSDRELPLAPSSNLKINRRQITAQEQFEILLRCNTISTPTVVLKRNVLLEVGGFNEAYDMFEDRPLWVALTKAGYKIFFFDYIGVKYRIHSGSVQVQNLHKKFQSKFEAAKDKFQYDITSKYLPFIERCCLLIVLYRNKIIRERFNNRFNPIIKFFSSAIGFIPLRVLAKYRKKYV